MVATPYIPGAGDLVWLSFTPSAGHEQAGRRPAVILSPRPYNAASGLAVACPVTSQVKAYPFEVRLPRGLPVSGVVLADHLRSVDWRARRAEHCGEVGSDVLEQIHDLLRALLDL